MGHAVLDQLGGDQTRVRAWLASDLAAARLREASGGGTRLDRTSHIAEEKASGRNIQTSPDSVGDLAYALTAVGRSQDAVVAAGRAVESFLKYGDSGFIQARAYLLQPRRRR
jgi:hypothetical protein